jgi:hypothetical protein
MSIDWKSLITGLLAGAIGWIGAGALTIVASAVTGGPVIHWMGGATKDDLKEMKTYEFGGIYTQPSGNAAALFPKQFGNALYNDARACPPDFSENPVSRILLDTEGSSYADIYVCTRTSQDRK